jgi:hypothetical protein
MTVTATLQASSTTSTGGWSASSSRFANHPQRSLAEMDRVAGAPVRDRGIERRRLGRRAVCCLEPEQETCHPTPPLRWGRTAAESISEPGAIGGSVTKDAWPRSVRRTGEATVADPMAPSSTAELEAVRGARVAAGLGRTGVSSRFDAPTPALSERRLGASSRCRSPTFPSLRL